MFDSLPHDKQKTNLTLSPLGPLFRSALMAQPPSHLSNFTQPHCLAMLYKTIEPEMSLGGSVRCRFSEIPAVCLMTCPDRKTDSASVWLSVLLSLSWFSCLSLFSCPLSYTLFLSSSVPVSFSLSLMPLSVWRLIKQLPSQPPPHQPSPASPRYQLPATVLLLCACMCVCAHCMRVILCVYLISAVSEFQWM